MGSITPRRLDFPLDTEHVSSHWFGNNALASRKVDSLNLIFPDGERFFIRSVRRFLPTLKDPALQARARDFFAQEALHGRAHSEANSVLRARGVELDRWLAWYQRAAFGRLERYTPAVFCLSVTAALEHLTASLAHYTLTNDLFAQAEPTMRDLMRWHAAEEIEHKSVAFDVLQAVNSRWIVRAAGMVFGLATLLFFWTSAWRHISAQDPALTPERIRSDRQELRSWGITDIRRDLVRYALGYFRPGFHPDDQDDYALAEEALAELTARYSRTDAAAGG
ncbi:MAG: putative metal-dependent hydrolase [Myxococcota bacterium]